MLIGKNGQLVCDGVCEMPMAAGDHESVEQSRGGGNERILMHVNIPGLTAFAANYYGTHDRHKISV